DEIRSRISELDTEFAGQVVPDEQRGEWNSLNEEFDTNVGVLKEIRARKARVEAINEKDENTDGGLDVPNIGRGRVTGEAIFDLTTIRSDFSRPEQAVGEMRDRAKRAIE